MLVEGIVVGRPSSEHAGEVKVDEKLDGPVDPEPGVGLRHALVVGDGTSEVDTSLTLKLSDPVVSLLELLVSALQSCDVTSEDLDDIEACFDYDDENWAMKQRKEPNSSWD